MLDEIEGVPIDLRWQIGIHEKCFQPSITTRLTKSNDKLSTDVHQTVASVVATFQHP